MAKPIAKPLEDPAIVLKEQSATNSKTNPSAPVINVVAPHPFQDIERQNALEELGVEAHVNTMTSIGITGTTPINRPGEFPIKVVGDPYAGFAKGPRDTK